MVVAGTSASDAAEQTVPFKTKPVKVQLSNGQGQRMAPRQDAPSAMPGKFISLLYQYPPPQKKKKSRALCGKTELIQRTDYLPKGLS